MADFVFRGSPAGVSGGRVWPVTMFGAAELGSNPNTRDDAGAFNAAIDAAARYGGIVWVPPLEEDAYRLRSQVTVNPNVKVLGANVGFHNGLPTTRLQYPAATDKGSLCYMYNASFDAFTLEAGSHVGGLELYWPGGGGAAAVPDGTPPAFGYAFRQESSGHRASLQSIALVNAYKGISLNAGGASVQQISGICYETALYLGRCPDVIYADTIHMNPSPMSVGHPALTAWIQANGSFVRITGAEQFCLTKVFCYGYRDGIWFDGAGDFHGVYGDVSVFGFDSVISGVRVSTNGLTQRGLSLHGGNIIPIGSATGVGYRFEDNTGAGSVDAMPSIYSHGVRFHGVHQYSVRIGATSRATVTMFGGRTVQQTSAAFLCESANGRILTYGYKVPSGTRIDGASSPGTVTEVNPL